MTAIAGVKNLIKEGVEDMTAKVWNEKQVTELYLLRERYNIPLEVIEEVSVKRPAKRENSFCPQSLYLCVFQPFLTKGLNCEKWAY